jgi:pyruvate,water dikinase
MPELEQAGGTLQHGALVAREYGKPCVAGIENATTVLADGQAVEIDGSSGIVRLV